MPIDYQLGKIYTIICNITQEQYIGSTCEPTLARRLATHRGAYRDWFNNKEKYKYVSSFQILARGNYQIVLLENYPCNDKDDLRMRERDYFDAIPNINMVKPYAYEEEQKERKKEDFEEHKDNLSEKHKIWCEKHKQDLKIYKNEWYEKNKEITLEKVKQYQQDHKEEISLKRKETYTCECGSTIKIYEKSRHIKSIKHQTFIKK